MIFSIISGLIAIGSAIAAGTMNNVENKKNRTRALGLANITRQDTLKRNARNNKLADQQLGLNQDKINLNRTIADMTITEKEKEKDYTVGTVNQSFQKQGANRLLGGLTEDPLRLRR